VATAPVRVADVGGWTDTWFADRGAVCNVAVGPGARVVVRRRADEAVWITHPQVSTDALLHQAVAMWGGEGVDVHVSAAVPPGSSLGTSAAVLVALVAALAAVDGDELGLDEAARRAHLAETAGAGRESGVQDHVAAAHGGLSWIEVGPFPQWRRRAIEVPAALAERVVTVHLGGAHDSSALHGAVIARAEAGDGHVHRVLADLVALAGAARERLEAGDVDGWGAVLSEATEAQARLHPALVGEDARAVGAAAVAHGAAGWKVNGAGGAGGSVTVVAPEGASARRAMLAALPPTATVLDLAPSAGLEITNSGE